MTGYESFLKLCLLWRPAATKVHIKINTTVTTKVWKSRNSVHPGRGDQRWSIKIAPEYQAVVTVLTGNGLNPHPSDACLTATQQLPASRVKTSDRESTLPLDANVGHTCFLWSHFYIKNHWLTSYSPQIGSDLPVCETCFVCFHVSASYSNTKQKRDTILSFYLSFFLSLVFVSLDVNVEIIHF